MTLTDPRPALAEQSSLISYLMGIAAMAGMIDMLATDAARVSARPADDFVHVLLGVASLGKSIEHLVGPLAVACDPEPPKSRRWLR